MLPKQRRPYAGSIAVHFFRHNGYCIQSAYPYYNPTKSSLDRLTRAIDHLQQQNQVDLSLSYIGMGWVAHLRTS